MHHALCHTMCHTTYTPCVTPRTHYASHHAIHPTTYTPWVTPHHAHTKTIQVCSGCNMEKPANDYLHHRRSGTGLLSLCSSCCALRSQQAPDGPCGAEELALLRQGYKVRVLCVCGGGGDECVLV